MKVKKKNQSERFAAAVRALAKRQKVNFICGVAVDNGNEPPNELAVFGDINPAIALVVAARIAEGVKAKIKTVINEIQKELE